MTLGHLIARLMGELQFDDSGTVNSKIDGCRAVY